MRSLHQQSRARGRLTDLVITDLVITDLVITDLVITDVVITDVALSSPRSPLDRRRN